MDKYNVDVVIKLPNEEWSFPFYVKEGANEDEVYEEVVNYVLSNMQIEVIQ